MISLRPLSLRIKIISFRIRVTRFACNVSNTESSKNCTIYISVASCRASRAVAFYGKFVVCKIYWYYIYLVMFCLGNMSMIISLTKRAKGCLGMRKCVVLLRCLISCSTWLVHLFLLTITVV
ncbi:hypothetical protein ALC60_00615 [Trachymyrmex zeteki]|uniref:Uncharacterized protein n=1 Tax=Mycetomoellerius zeteki TaxID=64791 RepID=A0A151XIV1_9HYME|nr:hypothetical protein ALC60_00615 [Trachymyrmex zeteki]